MTNHIQPATESDVRSIALAQVHLRRARDLLATAKASKAVVAVRRAIKSADGARRHVAARFARSKESNNG